MPRLSAAKAADARVAQADASVLAAAMSRAVAKQPSRPTTGSRTSGPACDALDLLDELMTPSLRAGDDTQKCIAALEELEELSSVLVRRSSTAARALEAAMTAMWNGRDLFPETRASRHLLGFGCMLLSAVLDSLDDHADSSLVAAVAEHIDGAERAVRRRTGDEEVSAARLLASGLFRLNSAAAASPRADLAALLVRGLLSIAEAHAAGGQGGKPVAGVEDGSLILQAMPPARAGQLLASGGLGAAAEAALRHPGSAPLHTAVVDLLSAASGPRPDKLRVQAGGAGGGETSMAAALVRLRTVPLLVSSVRAFHGDVPLMLAATGLLGALLRTEAGREAARGCDAAGALSALADRHPADEELQREMGILRALIETEELEEMLRRAGAIIGPDGGMTLVGGGGERESEPSGGGTSLGVQFWY